MAHAVRLLAKERVFALVCVISLGIGMGALVALVTFYHAIMAPARGINTDGLTVGVSDRGSRLTVPVGHIVTSRNASLLGGTNSEIRGGPVQKPITAVVVALIALYTVGVTAQTKSADPWIGTWKTDLAKSTFSPGPKPTVPATVTIERSASGMKTVIDAADPQGKPTHTETAWMFDGKDHPVKGAPVANTTAAYKRIDDRTFEVTSKVDGKPTTTTKVAISADGKTMTATQSGKNAQGDSVSNVIVATKQ